MSRIFAYCRVSTDGQTPANQVQQIADAGFCIEPQRIIQETVSGSQAAMLRPGFRRLVDRMEQGDSIVVTKLDRLGRSALDVRQTVDMLAAKGIKVICLALGGTDLTSSTGKLTMGVIAAVAEFELDLIKERTRAGLERAKAQHKTLGRPRALTPAQEAAVRSRIVQGHPLAAIARDLGCSRATVQRLRPVPAAQA